MTAAAERFPSSNPSQNELVQPFDGESVAGFFLRLAEMTGSTGPSSAAKRFGVTLNELRWGPRQRRGNSARISGHHIPLGLLDLTARRICPSCLDESRFVREWWEISILSACPIHGVAMRSECPCGKALSWNDGRLDRCNECYGLAEDMTPLPQKEITPLEDIVARRVGILECEPMAEWLETSSLSFLLGLFEKVGILAETGYEMSSPAVEADVASRVAKMDRGLHALQSDQFEMLIDRCIGEFRDSNKTEFCKRPLDGLGWFGDWIGGEQLPGDHLFFKRLKAAMETAWGCEIIDLQRTGVMHISVLGERLKLPQDTAIEIVCSHLGYKRLRGC